MCGEEKTCPVHYRLNVREDVTDEYGTGRAFTYEGDYCVVTLDNRAFTDPMTALMALLGGPDDPMPGMFMTMVVKVGDKAVGDLSPEELTDLTVHREEFVHLGDYDTSKLDAKALSETLTEVFHDKHDEAVLAVQSGLIS